MSYRRVRNYLTTTSALTWIGGQNGNALGKKISDGFAAGTAGVAAMMNSSGMMGNGSTNSARINKLKEKAEERNKKKDEAGGDKGGK